MSLAAVLQVVSSSDGFTPPSISIFFPPAVLFDGSLFAINRVVIIRLISTVALVSFFLILGRNWRVVPSRVQSVGEMLLDFVRVSIVEELLGKEQAKRFVPLITTVFLGLLAMNVTEIIPFLNMPSTALIGPGLVLALTSWFVFIYAGSKRWGFGGYLKRSLFPPGVPPALYVILTPIEFLSTFILRPFTLTIRLLANMIVGNMLLALTFAATQFLLFEAGGLAKAAGVITGVGALVFTLFEILIEVLQAYIFAILFTAYIQLALAEEH